MTQIKGHYTGQLIKVSDFGEKVKIGKISGYNGYGEPVYDIMGIDSNGRTIKVGEMGNKLIKGKLKLEKVVYG